MPIIAATPPADAVDAIHSTFQPLAETASFRLPALRNSLANLSLAQPHQVFNLGLSDLAATEGLGRAQPVGWRYLIQAGDQVVAAADAVTTGAGSAHVFSAFNQGSLAASTARALQSASTLPQVAQGSFEPRVLNVPALHVAALWLHQTSGAGGDLMVPLDPATGQSQAGPPVPAAQFLQSLAARAAAVASVGPEDTLGG